MTPAKSSATSSTTFTVVTGRAKPPPPRFRLRRRHVVRAVGAVAALVVIYFFGCEPSYSGNLVVHTPHPLVFAHRGFGDQGPDNSLLAVQHALDVNLDGVDMEGAVAPARGARGSTFTPGASPASA